MKNNVQKTPKTKLKIEPRLVYLLASAGMLSAVFIRRDYSISGFLGAFLLSITLFFIFYRDIFRYKPKYIKSFNMILLLASLIVGILGLGRFSSYLMEGLSRGLNIPDTGAFYFGVPMAAGAMLVTMLFDFHTALTFSFIVSLLSGLWLHDAVFTLYVYTGSLASAFSVIRCKRRTAILKGGLYILAANIFTIAIIYLFRTQFFTMGLPMAIIFGTFSAIASIGIVSIILPILETVFNVTTDISLLELLDLDQPLMKNLMVNAPGTYHHSIIVGNMVDAVAESIGVNPLLARVGSYYHDIGKVKMPEYFIENSTTSVSKHESLTPHMSSMILISHVKEGVELAKQYKLPEPILEIIEQHHGSSLMTYFYEKAKNIESPDELSKDDYKYPGPRPQSRVSALVMMADAVEAASRVLHDPTPARISFLVDKIIDKIYLEGQLDECELTFKDIYEIKKTFTHILTGTLHKRIDYPGFNFGETKGNGGSAKQQSKEVQAKSQRDKEAFPEFASPYGT